MKPVKITDRNIMFTEPMGETYDLNLGLILGKNRNYVIDTGRGSGSVQPVLDYIGKNGKPVVVINTHYHWDHMWGNFVFENGLIIAHSKCLEFANKFWDKAFEGYAAHKDGEVRKVLPNLTFEEKLCFRDDGITIFYSPGHSSTCCSVYDEIDKVLHAGDNIGDTDDMIVPYIDTDLETFKNLIGLYKKYDFEICISGHNKPQKKDVVSRMEAVLVESWEKQIAQNGLPGSYS